MLDLFTTLDEEIVIPLASDPVVAAENPIVRNEEGAIIAAPLAQYRLSGDVGVLRVPPEATLVRLRCLSLPRLRELERQAGEYSHAGQSITTRVLARTEELALDGRRQAHALARAELTEAEWRLYHSHNSWTARRDRLIARECVVAFERGGDVLPGSMAIDAVEANGSPAGEAMLAEAAIHVIRLATLGKAPKPSFATLSGANTQTTPADGTAQGVTASSAIEKA